MAIKMSPDELRSYAQKLLRNSQEAIALAKTIDSNIKAAASNWEGKAQAAIDALLKDDWD